MTQHAAAALRRTAERYETAGRFTRHYVASKLRRDPVAPALLALAADEGFGAVADIGCGRGQFGAALLEAGAATSVIGLDCKGRHLAEARIATSGLPFEARLQDLALQTDIPASDTVLMIDVLYQLKTAAQASLLRRAAQAAKHRIIIRTADPNRGMRSFVTRALETGFRRIWPHAGATVNPWPIGDLLESLRALGFTCVHHPCWSGTPFSNVLLVARRT